MAGNERPAFAENRMPGRMSGRPGCPNRCRCPEMSPILSNICPSWFSGRPPPVGKRPQIKAEIQTMTTTNNKIPAPQLSQLLPQFLPTFLPKFLLIVKATIFNNCGCQCVFLLQLLRFFRRVWRTVRKQIETKIGASCSGNFNKNQNRNLNRNWCNSWCV